MGGGNWGVAPVLFTASKERRLRLSPSILTQGVKDSDELRKAVEEVQPENVKLGLRLAQSR